MLINRLRNRDTVSEIVSSIFRAAKYQPAVIRSFLSGGKELSEIVRTAKS